MEYEHGIWNHLRVIRKQLQSHCGKSTRSNKCTAKLFRNFRPHGKTFSEFPPQASSLVSEKAAKLFRNLHFATGSLSCRLRQFRLPKWPRHLMLSKPKVCHTREISLSSSRRTCLYSFCTSRDRAWYASADCKWDNRQLRLHRCPASKIWFHSSKFSAICVAAASGERRLASKSTMALQKLVRPTANPI
jgi:hypothetical protein